MEMFRLTVYPTASSYESPKREGKRREKKNGGNNGPQGQQKSFAETLKEKQASFDFKV